jgi:hypothetical protein
VRDALQRLDVQRFDYLVNNAGASHHNAFDRTNEAELDALAPMISKANHFAMSLVGKHRGRTGWLHRCRCRTLYDATRAALSYVW